ncbi:MAG: hypothetical protein WCK89_25780, partial [bacterium]
AGDDGGQRRAGTGGLDGGSVACGFQAVDPLRKARGDDTETEKDEESDCQPQPPGGSVPATCQTSVVGLRPQARKL